MHVQADLLAMNVPWFESPLFNTLLEEQKLSQEERQLARHFAEEGYVLLNLEQQDIEGLCPVITGDLHNRYEGRERVQDAWRFSSAVRSLAIDSQVLRILRLFYQRDPLPFQTLNFHRGTQQATHSDTIHFHSVPHRFMCGVWVALEDIDEENGPLHVYPGSHTLPIWNFHDLGLPAGAEHYHAYEACIQKHIEALGLQKKLLTTKKGQAVIWAANLLHGGERILDPMRSRHSQVTHYFFADCLYYTPMLSEPYLGKVHLRHITDIRTGLPVKNRYNGKDVDMVPSPTTKNPTRIWGRKLCRFLAHMAKGER